MSSLLFIVLFGLTYFAVYFTFQSDNNISKYSKKCNFTSNKNPYIYNFQNNKYYKFVSTSTNYNGNTTYDGLFKACRKEFPQSSPCTIESLVKGYFWKFTLLPTSWILKLSNNCLGYTTNSSYTLGTCVDTSQLAVTDCSCEMMIPICCVLNR